MSIYPSPCRRQAEIERAQIVLNHSNQSSQRDGPYKKRVKTEDTEGQTEVCNEQTLIPVVQLKKRRKLLKLANTCMHKQLNCFEHNYNILCFTMLFRIN